MMLLRLRPCFGFSFSTPSLAKYLQPFPLQLHSSPTIPTLKLKSQKHLLENWWSETPFQLQGQMLVPVFNFHTNQYTQQMIELPTEIFNQPLRRDLIYRLFDYRRNLNKFSTKLTKTKGTTSGSGKKLRGQKKSGKARIGQRRAPHLKGGGKAHGAKPKVFSYPLNAKIKLKAICALMSAKMSEGKIKIVDSEVISQGKTKILAEIIGHHESDKRAIFCIITNKQGLSNFALAQRNIRKVIWHDSYNLDINSILVADKIMFTLQGLKEFVESIRKTHYVIYRQPYMEKLRENEPEEKEEEVKWDPEKPYEFKFKILAQYLELYEKAKSTTPDLLEQEYKRVRKVA